jgi:hypothetical protein
VAKALTENNKIIGDENNFFRKNHQHNIAVAAKIGPNISMPKLEVNFPQMPTKVGKKTKLPGTSRVPVFIMLRGLPGKVVGMAATPVSRTCWENAKLAVSSGELKVGQDNVNHAVMQKKPNNTSQQRKVLAFKSYVSDLDNRMTKQ